MLIGISPLVAPELLAALCRMGHGEELVLAKYGNVLLKKGVTQVAPSSAFPPPTKEK